MAYITLMDAQQTTGRQTMTKLTDTPLRFRKPQTAAEIAEIKRQLAIDLERFHRQNAELAASRGTTVAPSQDRDGYCRGYDPSDDER